MDLQLIADAPLAIRLHLVTVVPAFLLGTWLLFGSAKGSRWHRTLGFVYLTLMTLTAIAALFVQELRPGRWSWIHLFVPLTFWGVFAAIWRIRRGDIAGHKRAMFGLYLGGLLIAGGFTFFPGRMMHRLFFG
jgi:uncharacterized membrane protein